MNFALSRGKRGIGAVALALTLTSAAPAHAAKEHPKAEEPRLVQIGPQALVSIDSHGRATMVDEPAPEPTVGSVVRGAVTVMGVGALLFLHEAGELIFDRSTPVRR